MTQDELKATQIFVGKGCGTCNKTGYKGRVGIYQVLPITDAIARIVDEPPNDPAGGEHVLEELPDSPRNKAIAVKLRDAAAIVV